MLATARTLRIAPASTLNLAATHDRHLEMWATFWGLLDRCNPVVAASLRRCRRAPALRIDPQTFPDLPIDQALMLVPDWVIVPASLIARESVAGPASPAAPAAMIDRIWRIAANGIATR